jgi:hypothetical protein
MPSAFAREMSSSGDFLKREFTDLESAIYQF